MGWLKVEITTKDYFVDVICGLLVNLGISGLEVVNRQDFVEFIDDNNKQWDFVDDELMTLVDQIDSKIICYIPDNEDGLQLLEKVKVELATDDLLSMHQEDMYSIDVIDIGEDNWTEAWKKYYKPIEIGERLLINPIWEDTPATDRVVLKMNPGNMFGTGAHQSTQLCLEFIEKYLRPQDKVFDVGCGSGILAIGAILLGAESALALSVFYAP